LRDLKQRLPALRDQPLERFARVYVLDPFGNRLELVKPR